MHPGGGRGFLRRWISRRAKLWMEGYHDQLKKLVLRSYLIGLTDISTTNAPHKFGNFLNDCGMVGFTNCM